MLGSDLPSLVTNSTSWNASIPFANQTVSWNALPNATEGWDGFALLVDDVERYVGTALNYSLAALDPKLPHFFRLAVSGSSSGYCDRPIGKLIELLSQFTSQGQTADFTNAATLWPNGSWVDPLPGASF